MDKLQLSRNFLATWWNKLANWNIQMATNHKSALLASYAWLAGFISSFGFCWLPSRGLGWAEAGWVFCYWLASLWTGFAGCFAQLVFLQTLDWLTQQLGRASSKQIAVVIFVCDRLILVDGDFVAQEYPAWAVFGELLGLGTNFSHFFLSILAGFSVGFFDSFEICCLLSILADFSTILARLHNFCQLFFLLRALFVHVS